MKMNVNLIDYEKIVNEEGKRLIFLVNMQVWQV